MAVKKSPPKIKAKVRKSKPVELAEKSKTGIRFYEAGTSGLKEWYGFVSEAYNASLYWPTVQPLYSRLRRSMPEIVSIRLAFTSWARSVKPVVNLPDDPTDDDKEYQEFLDTEFENWEGGFAQWIDTAVNQVPFMGWGWWEAVPGLRDPNWKPPDGDDWRSEADDGLIGLRRLAWRDSSTFFGWDMNDKKKLQGLKQQDMPNPVITLPLKDSLHLTFGDPYNPEGLSPLEAVWRLERLKYGYEVVMGIGAEHAAGHLKVNRTSEGVVSEGDKTAIAEAAKNLLAAQEGNYGYFPSGLDGNVIDVPFSAGGFLLETLKHYSIMVYSVYMMQFVALNTMTSTGAQASQVDSTDMGVFTYNAMMDGFASQFDQQIGKRLYTWNKDAFPNLTKRPKITFSHIDKSLALGELGSFLTQIDGIINLGENDIKAIRKRSGFLPESEPNPEDVIISAQETRKLDQKAAQPQPQPQPADGKAVDEKAKTKEMAELGWDESLHPRDPKGESTGGHWTSTTGVAERESKAEEMSVHLIDKLRGGGFSESLDGVNPKTGYMTAITNKTEKKISLEDVTKEHLRTFIVENFNTLSDEDMYFGGWLDTDKTGQRWAYFDSSKNIQNLQEAVDVAVSSHQKAIYDLKGDRSLYIDYDQGNRLYYWLDSKALTGKTWI